LTSFGRELQRLSPALKINIREAIYRLSGIYGKEFTLNGGIPSDLLYKCSASTVYMIIGKNTIFFYTSKRDAQKAKKGIYWKRPTLFCCRDDV
jgi:hypothetical protein